MRKTKIVCTIGPACRDEIKVRKMIESGMNVARLNFSHGDHEYHKGTVELLKKVRKELDSPLAIMLDTRGPEIRLKNFKDGFAELPDNADFTLTVREVEGDAGIVTINYSELPAQLSVGDTVLIDDGKIELVVETLTETDIMCKVVHGGRISDHKGVNVPKVSLDMVYMSEQDKNDLQFGIDNDIDFVSASFVRKKQDVIEMRKFLDFNGGHDIRIIAKIENTEGIENFDDILDCSDGIMVARGDMGVEVEYERLPGLQKRFIRKCYRSGKMVITATQMLESMMNSPNPTRAEITDVANAVFDGTSAVMLSGETAAGKYPIEAVKTMAKIAQQAEKDAFDLNSYVGLGHVTDTGDMPNAVCDAACRAARDIKAKAIIVVTKYGQTARGMSKFRPEEPIIAATPVEKTFHQLALSWGVYPVLARYQRTSDELLRHAIDCAKKIDAVRDGDVVVIVAGVPLDTPGSTNMLKVETVSSIAGKL
ncbi:MAG: pyruvate kinase [Oscillospiraceae bacterium]